MMNVDTLRKAVARSRLLGEPLVVVGHFHLVRWRGAGAMGSVYEAYDPALERLVAIKILHAGANPNQTSRVYREAKALARVNHPHVVTVHDVGTWQDRPFLAMELVEGATLAEWQAMPGRTLQQVLQAYREAGRGLAAAHAAGVVHRDFKPTNAIVGDDGRVRVVDFGLAEAPTEHAAATGTPAYMAPEVRARGRTDALADQFSFSVALEEALRTTDAPVPLNIRNALARGRAESPEARWPDMPALLAAIEAPPRHRAPPWAQIVAVVATTAAMTWLCAPPVESDGRTAKMILQGAERLLAHDPTAAAAVLRDLDPAVSPGWQDVARRVVAESLAVRERAAARRLSGLRAVTADRRWVIGGREGQSAPVVDLENNVEPFVLEDVLAVQANGERILARAPNGMTQTELRTDGLHRSTITTPSAPVAAAFEGQQHHVLAVLANGSIWRYVGATGALLRTLPRRLDGQRVSILPTGEVRILDKTALEVWPADASAPRRLPITSTSGWRMLDGDYILAIRPDAATFEAIDRHGRVHVLPGDLAYFGSVDHYDRYLAAPTRENLVHLWDVSGEQPRLERVLAHANHVVNLRFGPQGRYLAAGSIDRTARVWDLHGQESFEIRGHQTAVVGVFVGPNADHITTTTADGMTRLWTRPATSFVELRGHEADIWTATMSEDGDHLLTAALDGTARLWDLTGTTPPRILRGHQSRFVYATALSPNLRRAHSARAGPRAGTPAIATGAADGTARLWSLDGTMVAVLPGHEKWAYSVAFSPDAKSLLTGSFGGVVRRFALDAPVSPNRRRGAVWGRHPGDGRVEVLKFSPTGDLLASAASDGSILLHDPQRRTPATVLGHHEGWIHDLAFTPDGRRIVSGARDGQVKIWSVDDRRLLHTMSDHDGWVLRVAIAPNGQSFASASVDGTIRRWALDGQPLGVLRGHTDWVHAIAFDKTGQRLVSGGYDHAVRVWDLSTGGPPLVLRGHAKGVRFVAFTPKSSSQLISAARDGTVRVWRLPAPSSTDDVQQRLRRVSRCLSADVRQEYLAEEMQEAQRAAEDCAVAMLVKRVRRSSAGTFRSSP